MLKHHLGADTGPLYCTKIASKLTRTYTDRHGLKDIVKELLGIDLYKQQQSSDWGAPILSDAQKQYAAHDVLYLHEIKARFDQMLKREGRMELAQACFDFLPVRAQLDLAGLDGRRCLRTLTPRVAPRRDRFAGAAARAGCSSASRSESRALRHADPVVQRASHRRRRKPSGRSDAGNVPAGGDHVSNARLRASTRNGSPIR